jgi:exodeoxyribonuclease III
LQELKAADAEFPAEAIKEAGYEAIWRGQKIWNGVAISQDGSRLFVGGYKLCPQQRVG